MAAETTTEQMVISEAAIDRVDGELGFYDQFRQDELSQLYEHNGALRLVVMNLFELTIQRGGEEHGRQAMAGSLFASRVLRYASEETGVPLPRVSLLDHGKKLKTIADRLVPIQGEEIDYSEFEIIIADQQPVLNRLQQFKNPISRMAATAIFMLHEEVL